MPISQVFDKLKAKRLLKPVDLRPIPNPLPSRFDVNKRCAFHQGLGCDTHNCFGLGYAIQNLIDNMVIVPPTRPNIIDNPLPNHNFGKGSRINWPMIEEESKEEEDLSNLIYDLFKCFMMTWEELMDRTSTTTVRYDIWNEEVLEPINYSTSAKGGRHFKPQINNQTPPNEGRHFKPQVNNQTPTD